MSDKIKHVMLDYFEFAKAFGFMPSDSIYIRRVDVVYSSNYKRYEIWDSSALEFFDVNKITMKVYYTGEISMVLSRDIVNISIEKYRNISWEEVANECLVKE